MTWSETHRRTAVLDEAEAAVERQGGGPLPWREEYAAAYPDRDALLLALAHRLRVRREAQLDPGVGDVALRETRRALAARHAGLIRLLEGPAAVVPSARPPSRPTARPTGRPTGRPVDGPGREELAGAR